MRILDRERQRGPGLIAVERTVAGRVEPERARPLPYRQQVRRFAGPSAFVAGAARPGILRRRRAEIGTEAEAFVGQRDRAVRISLTCGDAVAKAGDEEIAHRDLGGNALAAVRPGRDVDGCHRCAAVADPGVDRLGAVEGGSLRAVAIVERPGAGGADRDRPAQPHHDRVIDRRQVTFLDVVAIARLADAPSGIDAKPVDGVARPASAVALYFQRLFGGQHAASASGVGVKQKIPLLAEQAEAVADLPGYLQGAVAACGLGFG